MELKIVSLQPTVYPDKRRVMLEMEVAGLPPPLPPVFLRERAEEETARPDYPHIELSIRDEAGRELASLLIIEQNQPRSALTLHLPPLKEGTQYRARAEMIYREETIDIVETPFTLTDAT